MSDIVERLREWPTLWQRLHRFYWWLMDGRDPRAGAMWEAAAEIERLQAELREAREALDAAMAMLYECQTADGADPSDLFVAVAAFQCGVQNDEGREMIRAFLAK